ncbi:MAG: hypothetical protein A2341_17520 [Deltaproteobacteria bacterium RIFOXYB12_FULL_58_9]|nr:MAG: hypothetical protein A2341_17520 [Deltaproteobacteria bacterium RIFOXYB12_FULL_58_9]
MRDNEATPITADQRFVPAETVAAKVLESEMVFVELSAGEFFSANLMGTRIWDLFCQGLSVKEVVADLATRYAIATEQLEHDVQAFATALVGRGLLVRAPR